MVEEEKAYWQEKADGISCREINRIDKSAFYRLDFQRKNNEGELLFLQPLTLS